jgi:hypothetical protein
MPPEQRLPHRQIRHAAIHMRHQMQARWSRPRAFKRDVGQVVADKLDDLRRAIHVRDEFQIDIELAHRRQGLTMILRQRHVFVAHGPQRDLAFVIMQRAGQRIVDDGQFRRADFLRKSPDFPPSGRRCLVIQEHHRAVVARRAVPLCRNLDTALLVAAETAAIEHLHPLEHHVFAVRLKRFGQHFTDRVHV